MNKSQRIVFSTKVSKVFEGVWDTWRHADMTSLWHSCQHDYFDPRWGQNTKFCLPFAPGHASWRRVFMFVHLPHLVKRLGRLLALIVPHRKLLHGIKVFAFHLIARVLAVIIVNFKRRALGQQGIRARLIWLDSKAFIIMSQDDVKHSMLVA
jgi:hypothetical protein